VSVFSASGCCDAVTIPFWYSASRTTDVSFGSGSGILSTSISIPDGTWGVLILLTGTVESIGGASLWKVEIFDSVLGLLADASGDLASATADRFALQAFFNNVTGVGSRVITCSGTKTSGAGTPTLGNAELRIDVVPAANFTAAANI
jgi:hypothetical protein